MNIADAIFQRADRASVAVVMGEEAWNYGQLADLVVALAKGIRESGLVERGGRVGLFCVEPFEHMVLSLAILSAGGVVVPMAPELTERERAVLCEVTAVQTVLTGPSGGSPGGLKLEAGGVRACLVKREGSVVSRFDEEAFAALNPAFVRFSSGTTGKSKGVVLSHETLLARIQAANEGLQMGEGDRVIWILPMAHHFAVSIILYLWHGATTVVVPFHLADEVLTVARRREATVLYAAPFHHRLLAAEPSGREWPSLRLAVSTACPLPVETAELFRARYGLPLTQGLGIIEVGLPCLNLRAAAAKPESVGRALPAFELRVRDEAGRPVDVGEAGEVFIKGPGMLDAYLHPWQIRETILNDGWFATGDLGRVDAEGDLFLIGRVRSVINVGGMKCFPEEVEEVINGFAGVLECRVYGRAHAQLGALPAVEMVVKEGAPRPTVAALMAHCRRHLSRFKVPIEYRFVEQLARTASGKIKRC